MGAVPGTSAPKQNRPPAPEAAAEDEHTTPARETVEEVRVAMALNGGVSLAVWMGGCAVELDAARRAHLGPEDLRTGSEATSAPPPPGRERTIYAALCEAFGRELVIDVMSGSSAGGINGALLAAVIDRGRRLHPDYIRDKWLRLGDFGTLLHPLRTASPTSLMGGHAFFVKLRETFEELLPTSAIVKERVDDIVKERERRAKRDEWERVKALLDLPANQQMRKAKLAREVELDVTATDVRGEEKRFRDTWGEELVATEYRHRFRFRGTSDYNSQRLAMAARASASFPLAFEPWAVQGELLNLEGRRWLIDGGLLDNAPIRTVLELIPAVASDRPIRRFLCYLNADPPLTPTFDPEAELEDANAPDRPQTSKGDDGDETATAPQLQDVAAYMVSLPRKASFVDHLRAIQLTASRSATVKGCELPLLALDYECLDATASALLPAYRSRRRLKSLEDALDQPADIDRVAHRLDHAGGELPWIPSTLDVPVRDDDNGAGTDHRWHWGARAAERVLYLMLDLIQRGLDKDGAGSDPAARVALLKAREDIYAGRKKIDEIHSKLASDGEVKALMESLTRGDEGSVPSTLCALACLMEKPGYDPTIRDVVERAARTTFGVRSHLGRAGDVPLARALFGPGAESPNAQFGRAQFRSFLARTLRIEVIRRAFSAEDVVESEQPIRFAQLTPCAPTLIYTSSPLHPQGVPASPDEKLTGTRWSHFAAFYRASWRANDFMWGRLDASARVVDMLLQPEPEDRLDGGSARASEAAAVLAKALAPGTAFERDSEDSERRWLIAETMADASPVPEEEQHRELEWREAEIDRLSSASRGTLIPELTDCIAKDLTTGVGGHPRRAVTRALCVRAAQWEILRCELPHVIAKSKEDRGLGTSVPALDEIPAKDKSWKDGIEDLRKKKTPLPERLGVDDKAEQGSALMLRTASHGAMIGLSALRETRLPGAPAALLPRALLLPIAGMVAKKWWPYPLAVALGFWSFALVLAARLITLEPNTLAGWNFERWLAVGTTWLAAAGVVMVCLLPFWRVVRSGTWKARFMEAPWLIALVAAGGGVAIVLLLADGVKVVALAAQRGSEPPWEFAAALVWVSVGVFRLMPAIFPGLARRFVARVLQSAWQGPAALIVFLVPWLLLGGWAVGEFVWEAAWDGDHTPRDEWTARIALIAPGMLAFAYVLFSVQGLWGRAVDRVRRLFS